MKRLIVFLTYLSAVAFSGGAFADPPGKMHILHCGCVQDTKGNSAMAYVDVNVSVQAKGHYRHMPGTTDSCFNGTTYVDFQRSKGDCSADVAVNIPGFPACAAGDTAGSLCGEQVSQ